MPIECVCQFDIYDCIMKFKTDVNSTNSFSMAFLLYNLRRKAVHSIYDLTEHSNNLKQMSSSNCYLLIAWES